MIKDYALIFKKIENEDGIIYIPIDLAEGIYLEIIIPSLLTM